MQKNDEQKTKMMMFNDVEDADQRANNRGAMMANLYEAFGDGIKNTSATGLLKIMEYFREIPMEDRPRTYEFFQAHIESRGLKGVTQ